MSDETILHTLFPFFASGYWLHATVTVECGLLVVIGVVEMLYWGNADEGTWNKLLNNNE